MFLVLIATVDPECSLVEKPDLVTPRHLSQSMLPGPPLAQHRSGVSIHVILLRIRVISTSHVGATMWPDCGKIQYKKPARNGPTHYGCVRTRGESRINSQPCGIKRYLVSAHGRECNEKCLSAARKKKKRRDSLRNLVSS